jgi:predicted permease
MQKAYFLIAWRNLLKDKQFSFLNLIGLSVGLACSFLVFLWIRDEMSYDKFFSNDERLYQLLERRTYEGESFLSIESSGRLSDAVKQGIPEVEYAAAVAPAKWFQPNTLTVNNKSLKANVQYADKEFFQIFSFDLLAGDRSTLLKDKYSIVLSDELAIRLFGTANNIVGKQVLFDHSVTFMVSGIFKKMPTNSSQQFDFVLPFEYFKMVKDWVTYWGNGGPSNFVLLKEGTDINSFNNKVENIIKVNTGDSSRQVVASKFSNGYLYGQFDSNAKSGGRIGMVNLFGALACFILLIACINFMNLSTAKASRRLKEVGIKKVVGASRKQLIFQFLTESVLLTFIALVFSLLISLLLMPEFNQLTGKSIRIPFTWEMAGSVTGITLLTGLLAGSYPALYISGFNPLAILKGKLNTSTAELLSRKGLVVFQFSISAILIVAVTVVYQQIQFIRSVDLGYNKENVIRFASEGNILKNQESFLAEMRTLEGVSNAAYTYHSIVGRSYSSGLEWSGKSTVQKLYFEIFGVSEGFIETMDMKVIEGRSFSRDYGLDSLSVIINQTAVKALGLEEPLGATVRLHGQLRQVVGVVKDFHFESMHDAIKPAVMHLQSGEGRIIARISKSKEQAAIAAIEKLYKKYNPDFPFEFNFLDTDYQKQFESEARTASLSGYFASLAIIISCLGLFGLAAFTAQKRQKEIGVRKVIGASIANITTMLSKDFLKLVGMSLLISFQLSAWMMHDWLEKYTYRISLSVSVFVLAAGLVLLITIIAIGIQTIKAALANPIKSLRTE